MLQRCLDSSGPIAKRPRASKPLAPFIERYASDEKYKGQIQASMKLPSDAALCSMKLSTLLRRPGGSVLKDILEPELERQLSDVKTGQALESYT